MNKENRTEEGFSLELLRYGDKAEFAQLVDRYSNGIFRLILRMLGDQQDAEDALQETFIKAFKNLPKFSGKSRLSTWLYRIATNESLMLIRKRKPNQISIDETDSDSDNYHYPLKIANWCCLPEDELMSQESREFLDKAVDQLSQKLKVVFILRDIQDLSTRETAEVLKISETSVKTRLSRARLKLRELLTGYYENKITPEVEGS